MARIAATNDITVLKIKAFLGLNENPDGYTALKPGEMAEMKNFRITKDKHLQIRPGTKTVLSLSEALAALGGESTQADGDTRLCGVWRGTVGGREHILASYGGHIWDVDINSTTAADKGTATQDETTFFPFGGKVYLLNGHEYMSWDGGDSTTFQTVEGYVPLVQTATTPAGAGTLVESVNRLTGKRRVAFSPDGTAATFQLPEKDIDAVEAVTVNGEAVTGYAHDLAAGTVTFDDVPSAGTNTMEVTYRKGNGSRGDVTGMRYSELFNGSTDTRVFLYGDGTNRTIYSGIELDSGQPSAEYFPDLYELAVGESNTPITALIRHYSRMMAYKPNSAWIIQYGTITLEDSATTAAFYVQPVNRQFGNEAMGQVKLLENNPLTLDVGSVYQWRSTSSYTGYITGNENNAKRISDRVSGTLAGFDMAHIRTFNIKCDHEYWFTQDGKALILNYANDSWYAYENLPFSHLLEVEDEKYGFGQDGLVFRFSREYRNDDGAAIDCYAATGAMDFGRDWQLKYSPMFFVAMQPESGAMLLVTVETNRKSDYQEKVVAYNLAEFLHVDFNHFSFATNRKPQVKRIKMKVKKATFYRLIFKSNSASATATVLETDVQLRYAGNVK
ncbi:MAG: hypothetical protein ACI3V3_04275 [Faecousia sp.]